VADTIRLETASAGEAIDLIETLARRGLNAALVRECGCSHVEVSSPGEPTQRLLGDVLVALETWLADATPRAVRLRVGERTYTLESQTGD